MSGFGKVFAKAGGKSGPKSSKAPGKTKEACPLKPPKKQTVEPKITVIDPFCRFNSRTESRWRETGSILLKAEKRDDRLGYKEDGYLVANNRNCEFFSDSRCLKKIDPYVGRIKYKWSALEKGVTIYYRGSFNGKTDLTLTLDPAKQPKNGTITVLGPATGQPEARQRMIRIYLKLEFLDPEGAKRQIPAGLTLVMRFEKELRPLNKTVTVGAGGIVGDGVNAFVEVPRAVKSFTLDFAQASAKFVVCEKRGDPATQELVAEADPGSGALLTKLKADARMFRLPLGEWTLKNSAWDILETPITTATLEKPAYKFDNTEDPAAQIGASGNPVVMTLKPAWQFSRFTYYDRKLKGAEPISVPAKANGDIVPIVLQGWRRRAEELGGQQPDAQCFWAIGADETKVVQCLPWIVGKDNTNAEAKVKPDGETILRFNRGETNPFVHTVGATDRKLIDFTDATLRDRPGPARLDYYDLPKIWKSRKYFAWLSDTDCGPYEDMGAKDTAVGTPLVFCLDDIVLTDNVLAPLATVAADIALLSHTFTGPGGAAPVAMGPTADPAAGKPQKPTPPGARRFLDYQGLYNPLTADQKSYFSKVKMNLNYVADYPFWTRLVASGGNLFDVFDKRTADDPANAAVVGARAGVRWADNVTGLPAGVVAARPARTDNPFFSIQGLYEQEFAQRFAQIPYNHGGPATCRMGRFDYALMRCCDVDAGNEVATNLVYFRMNFNVTAPGVTALTYGNEFVGNVAKRWNGADGTTPASRVKFLPQPTPTPTPPLEVNHVWFGQSLPVDQAQFACDVTAGSGRSWFNGAEGTGELSPDGKGDADDGSGVVMWFVGAHECGHGVGLNDDYCERWSAHSYGQLSYRWHLPGDPYEPDGRTVEFHEAGAAMMNGNQQMRNRYFWPMAEWLRGATNTPFKVKLGTYDAYKVPPHATDRRTYAFWPLLATSDWQPDAAKKRGKSTGLLYALGAESYTATTLPGIAGGGAAMDGLFVVTVNIKVPSPDWPDANTTDTKRQSYLQGMATIIRDRTGGGLNGRFVVTGTGNATTPQEWQFTRALFHVSPRFLGLDTNNSTPADALTMATNLGTQFTIDWRWDTNPMAGKPTLQSLATFQGGTGGAARNPANATLTALDKAVGEYQAMDGIRRVKRSQKLDAIIGLCDTFTNNPPTGVTAMVQYHTRNTAVTALKNSAVTVKAFYDGLPADPADEEIRLHYRWNPSLAMPVEMTTAAWFGARVDNDSSAGEVSSALAAYEAILPMKNEDRITALQSVMDKCDSFSPGGDMGLLFADDEEQEKRAAAMIVAAEVRAEAAAMKTYLEAIRTSNEVRVWFRTEARLADWFSGHFPTMLGVEKPCSEVVAADLLTLVQATLPGAAIANA